MQYISVQRCWNTKRRIVVIESDDWGSVRMPSREVYDALLKANIRVDKCHYCKYDSVASEDDLELLFDVLNSVHDSVGHPAVITANALVANPDFQRIKEDNFQKYYYTKITDGIPKIKGCEKSLQLWAEGQKAGFFQIQSHGREHVNVARWMRYLNGDYPETKYAFDCGVYGVSTSVTSEKRKSFLPAFDFETGDEEQQANRIVKEALQLFKEIFGYKSESFIAPNYTWGVSLEDALYDSGVHFIQGTSCSKCPGPQKSVNHYRHTGKVNQNNQIDIVRNVFFEPSEENYREIVNSTLAEIDRAFKNNRPAVISTHRVNYISALDVRNRDNGLKQLKSLLGQIVEKWPNVEFVSSDQLGHIIESK